MCNLFIALVQLPQLVVHLQCLVDRDIQLIRNHLRNRIDLCIRHIQHTADIADDTARRQCTECDDLYNAVLAVFSRYIVDDLRAAFEAEIHVDIRHGNSFRVQETLEQELVPHRIQLCDAKGVGNNTSGRRSSSRSDHDVVVARKFDEIPHDQEVIDVTHRFDRIKLVFQPRFQFIRRRVIPFLEAVVAELIQIFP